MYFGLVPPPPPHPPPLSPFRPPAVSRLSFCLWCRGVCDPPPFCSRNHPSTAKGGVVVERGEVCPLAPLTYCFHEHVGLRDCRWNCAGGHVDPEAAVQAPVLPAVWSPRRVLASGTLGTRCVARGSFPVRHRRHPALRLLPEGRRRRVVVVLRRRRRRRLEVCTHRRVPAGQRGQRGAPRPRRRRHAARRRLQRPPAGLPWIPWQLRTRAALRGGPQRRRRGGPALRRGAGSRHGEGLRRRHLPRRRRRPRRRTRPAVRPARRRAGEHVHVGARRGWGPAHQVLRAGRAVPGGASPRDGEQGAADAAGGDGGGGGAAAQGVGAAASGAVLAAVGQPREGARAAGGAARLVPVGRAGRAHPAPAHAQAARGVLVDAEDVRVVPGRHAQQHELGGWVLRGVGGVDGSVSQRTPALLRL